MRFALDVRRLRRPGQERDVIVHPRALAKLVYVSQQSLADRPAQDDLGAVDVVLGQLADQVAPVAVVDASSVARRSPFPVASPDFGEVVEDASALAKK